MINFKKKTAYVKNKENDSRIYNTYNLNIENACSKATDGDHFPELQAKEDFQQLSVGGLNWIRKEQHMSS